MCFLYIECSKIRIFWQNSPNATVHVNYLEFSSSKFFGQNAIKKEGRLSQAYWRQKENKEKRKGLALENPKKKLKLKQKGAKRRKKAWKTNIRRIYLVKKECTHFSLASVQGPMPLPPPSLTVEEKRREQCTYLSLVALQGAPPTSCQWATAPPSLTVEEKRVPPCPSPSTAFQLFSETACKNANL